jgi:hypothetical protein
MDDRLLLKNARWHCAAGPDFRRCLLDPQRYAAEFHILNTIVEMW